MLKNHLFYFFLVVDLIGMLVVSNHPSLVIPSAHADAASQSAIQVTGEFCPFTAAELQSLHAVYLKDINVRMLETKDGPIGYDGGAFALSLCRIGK